MAPGDSRAPPTHVDPTGPRGGARAALHRCPLFGATWRCGSDPGAHRSGGWARIWCPNVSGAQNRGPGGNYSICSTGPINRPVSAAFQAFSGLFLFGSSTVNFILYLCCIYWSVSGILGDTFFVFYSESARCNASSPATLPVVFQYADSPGIPRRNFWTILTLVFPRQVGLRFLCLLFLSILGFSLTYWTIFMTPFLWQSFGQHRSDCGFSLHSRVGTGRARTRFLATRHKDYCRVFSVIF